MWDTAAATEHNAESASASERRLAADGAAATEHSAHLWITLEDYPARAPGDAAAATGHSPRPEDHRPCVATEHAQEPPPAPGVRVLLRTENIEQLGESELSFAPRRSLQQLARNALTAITTAGPNSSMDANLEHWFPWRSYVACHEDAHGLIGSGIMLAVAEFIDGTKDANQGGQPRLDCVFYSTD